MQFTEQVRKDEESLEVRTLGNLSWTQGRKGRKKKEKGREREGGICSTSEEKTKKKERQRECLGSGWGPNSLGAQK